jgi:hypothetical protein
MRYRWERTALDGCRACAIRDLNRVLALFGLTASDWQAHAYVIATRTGRQEIVDNTAHLWQAAARLRGKPCDPLDSALIARLEGEARP